MTPRRVVVTGMGCLTAAATSLAAFEQALFTGQSGIAEHTFADLPEGRTPGLKFTRTAQVHAFDPAAHLTPTQITTTERAGQFCLVAAAQAVAQASLEDAYPSERLGVVTGCSTGGRSWEEPETAKLYVSNARVHPLTVIRSMASSGASQVAMAHRATGPVFNVSTACASGTHAIGLAFQMIRSGLLDAALTGGHEAPLTWGFLRAWDSMRVVSPTRCRPFSSDRDGMTLGEGAAMLCLEDREHALARGAEILGEIAGFGMSSDASHITQPSPAGAAAAMQSALIDANLAPRDIACLNAHGTGTLANDAVEAEAIRRVFGPRGVPVSGTKSITGHAIGATGAIEAIATLLALKNGLAPHTANLTHPDPTLDLDLILHEPRPIHGLYALSNSLAFGGLNAVLALRRPE